MLQNVDDGIKRHIHLMVSQGVNFLSEMRPHVLEYLKTKFKDALPDRSNRRYWPTDRDITNHMHSAFSSMMLVLNLSSIHSTAEIIIGCLHKFFMTMSKNHMIDKFLSAFAHD